MNTEKSPAVAPLSLLKNPFIISLLTAGLTFVGTFSAVEVRVANEHEQTQELRGMLQQLRTEQISRDQQFVTRSEFAQFTVAVNSRLDDLRELLIQMRQNGRQR